MFGIDFVKQHLTTKKKKKMLGWFALSALYCMIVVSYEILIMI